MLDISFLPKGRGGNEFMDFQSTRFFDTLVGKLQKHITSIDGITTLGTTSKEDILSTIEEFCGFNNITIKYENQGNLAVDTGYFNPKNVLNNQGVDQWLNVTQSTMYRWFKDNKNKVFKGSINYRTGKVEGSFCSVPVNLYINVELEKTFPQEKLAKFGVGIAEVLAGALAHEMGHVFGACMMIHTQASDNLVAKAALALYRKNTVAEDRVLILRETAAILEEHPGKIEELHSIANNPNDESFILYFNKLTAQRNTRRSLSVGVETMSSEVIADMYAIRMGCSKGVIGAISVLTDLGVIRHTVDSLWTAALLTVLFEILLTPAFIGAATAGFAFFATISGVIFTFAFVMTYFSPGFAGDYNSNHRRFDDAVRQMIARLKEDPHVGAAEKKQLVEEVDKLLQLNKNLQPWYDNTVVERLMGYMFHKGDYKKLQIEHFTQVMANHEMNLLSNKLSALTARRDPNTRSSADEEKTFEA